jgi:hypothetical protein
MFLNESVASYEVEALREGYIDGSEASMMRILYESSEEWGTLTEKSLKMQATAALREDAYLLAEGMSEVWKKIKDFFIKLWGRIKQFFKKFWAYITGLVAMDKSWITKNQKLLDGLHIKEYTVTIYANKRTDTSAADVGNLQDLSFGKTDNKDAIDAIKEKYSTDKEETFFRGEREQVDIDSSKFTEAVKEFKGIDKLISDAKKTETTTDKLFKTIVAYVDKAGVGATNGAGYLNSRKDESKMKADTTKATKHGNTDDDKAAIKNAKLAASAASIVCSAATWSLKEYRADLKKIILKGLGSRMMKDEDNAHLEESYDFGVLSRF